MIDVDAQGRAAFVDAEQDAVVAAAVSSSRADALLDELLAVLDGL
ncbi:hypothetical protein [Rhodococcus sp. B50]|nr:hypothetical protein [Rhodococcus sp. B50]